MLPLLYFKAPLLPVRFLDIPLILVFLFPSSPKWITPTATELDLVIPMALMLHACGSSPSSGTLFNPFAHPAAESPSFIWYICYLPLCLNERQNLSCDMEADNAIYFLRSLF